MPSSAVVVVVGIVYPQPRLRSPGPRPRADRRGRRLGLRVDAATAHAPHSPPAQLRWLCRDLRRRHFSAGRPLQKKPPLLSSLVSRLSHDAPPPLRESLSTAVAPPLPAGASAWRCCCCLLPVDHCLRIYGGYLFIRQQRTRGQRASYRARDRSQGQRLRRKSDGGKPARGSQRGGPPGRARVARSPALLRSTAADERRTVPAWDAKLVYGDY